MVGAGDFIGAAIAKRFAAGGFVTAVGRRNADKLAPLVTEIEAGGGRARGFALDAREEANLQAVFETSSTCGRMPRTSEVPMSVRVEFHFDFGSPNAYLSHLVVPGAVVAQRLGYYERYVDELYRHMWAEPKKLDDPGVIAAALAESGLPAHELLALAADASVKQELIANTERSVARGNFGSPSFFVGDVLFFGKDRLRDVEEEIETRKREGR